MTNSAHPEPVEGIDPQDWWHDDAPHPLAHAAVLLAGAALIALAATPFILAATPRLLARKLKG